MYIKRRPQLIPWPHLILGLNPIPGPNILLQGPGLALGGVGPWWGVGSGWDTGRAPGGPRVGPGKAIGNSNDPKELNSKGNIINI